MKSVLKKLTIMVSICLIIFVFFIIKIEKNNKVKNYIAKDTIILTENEEKENKVEEPTIVYENMTFEKLVKQLNKSLNSNLSNKGELIASYSLKKEVDPVLATAIILHETGCKWDCSYLVKKCNNVGGVKGNPGCNGSSYKKYSSLDEGIKKFIDNLQKNYYSYGLDTPEKMNKKYAQSKSWASKVNNYIKEIKEK